MSNPNRHRGKPNESYGRKAVGAILMGLALNGTACAPTQTSRVEDPTLTERAEWVDGPRIFEDEKGIHAVGEATFNGDLGMAEMVATLRARAALAEHKFGPNYKNVSIPADAAQIRILPDSEDSDIQKMYVLVTAPSWDSIQKME